jgi:hypothetical protein
MRCLQEFAVAERLGASQITAIGALSGARLAFFPHVRGRRGVIRSGHGGAAYSITSSARPKCDPCSSPEIIVVMLEPDTTLAWRKRHCSRLALASLGAGPAG